MNELMIKMLAVLNNVDTAYATLMIGRDHGITPQALKACQDSAKEVQECIKMFKPFGRDNDVLTIVFDDQSKQAVSGLYNGFPIEGDSYHIGHSIYNLPEHIQQIINHLNSL